ncbi:YbaB/EbfC family nucleoid-associated protein [Ponticaulis sp.]|uniref:YbaB/EbfC family nucleoid-associated protein n=1 Tax=Ponticaulis sp. TaxID=2020902 RepID=UPI000B6F6C45|nr:YbaB/EbfC family nucleoid-associated protein [Ponticaulis sp.]MAI90293.1 YbaB/EbfC family nucleoid-associated protein [Ponticaulis sp.]OUX99935.1 MAG: YbaB/EbfC family nucleoid-associated protein [Hyphomonadaceae bacterium TMED5]|tara:strand:- start:271232 stop:271555 length:324 start_codon:yes stop_codon:yes gene_type:complete
MKDLGNIMRQAQEMQAKMQEAQEKAENVTAEGVAGGGMVRVTLKGKGKLADLTIDPTLMGDDAEIVEDLIKAAHADARKRLDEELEKAMKEATAGLGGMLPGFKMPF